MEKARAAIVGSGNIGTDLMYKLIRSDSIDVTAVIGIDPESEGLAKAREQGLDTSHDGADWLLERADEFDIVFSNSVIEHLGDIEGQRRMAKEIRRVGKYYYLQTPNRNFPVEPHFQFPFFQFLPKWLRTAIVRRWSIGWYPCEGGVGSHVRTKQGGQVWTTRME